MAPPVTTQGPGQVIDGSWPGTGAESGFSFQTSEFRRDQEGPENFQYPWAHPGGGVSQPAQPTAPAPAVAEQAAPPPPSVPWWTEAPPVMPVPPAEEAVPDQRTAPVVPPSPGILVAGPGVPSVDTRRAVPPAPLVEGVIVPPRTEVPAGFDEVPAAPLPQSGPSGTPSVWPHGTGNGFGPAPSGFPSTQSPYGQATPVPGAQQHAPATGYLPPPPASAGSTRPDGGPVAPGGPGPLGGPGYRAPANGPAPLPAPAGGGGNKKLLVIGGGVAGALLLGSLVFAGVAGLSGSPAKKATAAHSAPITAPSNVPSPQPSTASSPGPAPAQTGPNIDDEKTDPRPLSLSEVFPDSKITLAGKSYQQDKTSVNHDCSLTARGGMAQALGKGHCSSVVRATYVDDGKKLAVTMGIAVLPTKAAALVAGKAGDPATYAWFRGMTGKVATKIDQAGGYAASTVLGRYLIYSYAQYADGTKAQPNDATLSALAKNAIEYTQRPIQQRAH